MTENKTGKALEIKMYEQALYRVLALAREQGRIKRNIQVAKGRIREIDSIILAKQSSRLALEYEINDLARTYKKLDRDSYEIKNTPWPLTDEEKMVAAAKVQQVINGAE